MCFPSHDISHSRFCLTLVIWRRYDILQYQTSYHFSFHTLQQSQKKKKTVHTGKIIIWRLGTKYHGSQVLPRVDIQFHASVVKE